MVIGYTCGSEVGTARRIEASTLKLAIKILILDSGTSLMFRTHTNSSKAKQPEGSGNGSTAPAKGHAALSTPHWGAVRACQGSGLITLPDNIPCIAAGHVVDVFMLVYDRKRRSCS